MLNPAALIFSFILSEACDASGKVFSVPILRHQKQTRPALSVLTAVEMKDLLSSPSPHKEPPRPGRRESLLASSSSLIIAGSLSVCACMLERQNERGTVLLNVISFFLNYLFNFPCFESNVAVSVLCSDVPAPGRRHSFH